MKVRMALVFTIDAEKWAEENLETEDGAKPGALKTLVRKDVHDYILETVLADSKAVKDGLITDVQFREGE